MLSVVLMLVIVNELERLRALRVRPVSVCPRMRVLVHTTAVSVSGCLHRVVEDSSLLSLAQASLATGFSSEFRRLASADVAGDGRSALEVVLSVVVWPDPDRVGVRIDRNCRNCRPREQEYTCRRIAAIRDLVRPFWACRVTDEVATMQLVIASGGTRSDGAVHHEQPLFNVFIVVRQVLAGVEIVEVHRSLPRSQSTGDVQPSGEVLEEVHLRR